MPRESKRNKILEAAALIVHNRGIEALTLEAVAREAGLSKGGLLYHFSHKEAIIESLVRHMVTVYRENVERSICTHQPKEGEWIRAFIRTMYSDSIENKEISAGMLAAQGINPKLLKPLHDTYSEWQSHIQKDDGLDPVEATILRLAVDGLWLSDLFGLGPLDRELREKVLERLVERTGSASNTPKN
ncbi:MAG: TetR/AcrR family transcriptional regulator [Spirochaetaceae bacterium]|nr:TetR/AcrR family transcriptional regulator [Spirochaetaceae bacterium]